MPSIARYARQWLARLMARAEIEMRNPSAAIDPENLAEYQSAVGPVRAKIKCRTHGDRANLEIIEGRDDGATIRGAEHDATGRTRDSWRLVKEKP